MSGYHSKRTSELDPAEREEMMRRLQESRRRIESDRRPMAPDQDLTWENTNFKDYDND